jgi:hypothetical protein
MTITLPHNGEPGERGEGRRARSGKYGLSAGAEVGEEAEKGRRVLWPPL